MLNGCRIKQDILDHMAVDVGQTTLNAIVIEAETTMIESQQVQDRRVEIIHG